jgi:hypothetical protein
MVQNTGNRGFRRGRAGFKIRGPAGKALVDSHAGRLVAGPPVAAETAVARVSHP